MYFSNYRSFQTTKICITSSIVIPMCHLNVYVPVVDRIKKSFEKHRNQRKSALNIQDTELKLKRQQVTFLKFNISGEMVCT